MLCRVDRWFTSTTNNRYEKTITINVRDKDGNRHELHGRQFKYNTYQEERVVEKEIEQLLIDAGLLFEYNPRP